jgi:hypothetical protein
VLEKGVAETLHDPPTRGAPDGPTGPSSTTHAEAIRANASGGTRRISETG